MSTTNGQSDRSGRLAGISWRKVISRIVILIGFGLLVSLAIPAILSKPIELRTLMRFHPLSLAAALILSIVPMFLHAWTLWIWGRFFEKDLTYRESVSIAVTAILGSAVTPTMLGGAPVKLGLLAMHRFRAGQAAAVTSMGSLQDMLTFGLLIILSLTLSEKVGLAALLRRIQQATISPGKWLLIAAVSLAAAGLIWLFLTRSKWGNRIISAIRNSWKDFLDSFKLIGQKGKTAFLATLLINFLRWQLIFAILIVLLLGLGLPEMDYAEAWSQQWLVFSGMSVTPMPGGAGGAEAVFFFVYGNLVPEEVLVGLTLLWRFCTGYFRIIFSAVFVMLLPLQIRAKDNGDQ